MTYSQKDRLDRIQHTLLPTTEKKFHRKRAKNADFLYIFWATTNYVTSQYQKSYILAN